MAVTTASDLELAEQAAVNDQGAFGALYERHLAALYDYARRLMRDADEAADVAQVAFIKAFESIRRSGTAPSAFRPWLFQIAHNEAFDRLGRKRFVDPEGEEALARVPDRSGEASPEVLAEQRETADLVWRAARGLRPEEHRLVRGAWDACEWTYVERDRGGHSWLWWRFRLPASSWRCASASRVRQSPMPWRLQHRRHWKRWRLSRHQLSARQREQRLHLSTSK